MPLPENTNNLTPAQSQALADEAHNKYLKNKVRHKIINDAGDIYSLLGTTSDAAQMLLVSHCELLIAISSATTIADIKAAATSNSLFPDAGGILSGLTDGTVQFPYRDKGQAAVMGDIKTMSTAVAKALAP